MKRFVALCLLVLYLVSFTEVSEIMRLPILLEHYVEHKSKAEGQLSFLEFITMHYQTNEAHDETDNTLPFKGHDHSCCSPTVMLPLHKLALSDLSHHVTSDYSSIYLQHEPALRSVDIFQPPKI